MYPLLNVLKFLWLNLDERLNAKIYKAQLKNKTGFKKQTNEQTDIPNMQTLMREIGEQ